MDGSSGPILPRDVVSINQSWGTSQAEGDAIEPTEARTPTVPEFESFITKNSKVLHPSHVIIVDKKYTLAKMYGRMKGFEPGTNYPGSVGKAYLL